MWNWIGENWEPIGTFVVAVIALWLSINAHRLRRKDRVEDRYAPLREKVKQLRGIATAVEHFFGGRECEKNWMECGRVLALHAIDARAHGLYDSADFPEERVTTPTRVETEEEAIRVFVHLSSMMRRRRKAGADAGPPERAVPNFQKWLLEDIKSEIEIAQEQMKA